MHAKALRIRAFWSEIGRTPGCPACETPGPWKSHTRGCKSYQDAWDESRRTALAEEAKRGIGGDLDSRPLDPSSSSTGPNPQRSKNDLCDRRREPGPTRWMRTTSEGNQRHRINWKPVEERTSGKKRSSHSWRGRCEI